MNLYNRLFHLMLFVFIGLAFTQCTSNKETIKSSTGVELSQISYDTYVKPIIYNYCTTCHAGKSPSAGLDLQTYANVKNAAENRNLLKRINDHKNPMPVGGLMPKEERLTILRWAKNNFLEKTSTDSASNETSADYSFDPPQITPINIENQGFALLENMQGHWVGKMNLMGEKMPWFAFDYRAIGPSQVHGIFEGGTMGNLFTSFFLANFKGTKTIMARNGGVLNGIYRTSYFVLTEAKEGPNSSYYKLVDAYGGAQIMWMELTFTGDQLKFNSYTSRMGTYPKPTLHMKFEGTKKHLELAKQAADQFNFPSKKDVVDFSKGMPTPNWGNTYPVVTSASYLAQDDGVTDYSVLAEMAQDPYRMEQLPGIASLNLKLPRNDASKGKKVSIYLSRQPLTDAQGKIIMEYGYIKQDVLDEVLLFPELAQSETEFKLTYLHPGKYYVTAVLDEDGNMVPSKGDISSKSALVELQPLAEEDFTIPTINSTN
ncbi:hypothetical protein KFE94_15320 [bacterium SCSIO 12643]|nr:hypothetical protein KFE94_15320 [bacterium SCSIO 12643]